MMTAHDQIEDVFKKKGTYSDKSISLQNKAEAIVFTMFHPIHGLIPQYAPESPRKYMENILFFMEELTSEKDISEVTASFIRINNLSGKLRKSQLVYFEYEYLSTKDPDSLRNKLINAY